MKLIKYKSEINKQFLSFLEGDVEEEGYSDNSEDEWFFEQTPVVEVGSELHLISPTYGFANKTQGVFSQIKVNSFKFYSRIIVHFIITNITWIYKTTT